MKKQVLYDYVQLFDYLELNFLLDEDEEDDEVIGKAVIEYYQHLLFDFPLNAYYGGITSLRQFPEFDRGCDALRKLLSDMGRANITDCDKVWKVMAKLENYSLLKLGIPLLIYMWN